MREQDKISKYRYKQSVTSSVTKIQPWKLQWRLHRSLMLTKIKRKHKNKPTGTPEEMYNKIKTYLHKASKEALGEKITNKRNRNYWWNGEWEI